MVLLRSLLSFVPANARHHVQKESVMEQKTSLFSRRTTARRRRRDPKYKRQTANLGLREITENERGCLRKREWIFNESFSLFFLSGENKIIQKCPSERELMEIKPENAPLHVTLSMDEAPQLRAELFPTCPQQPRITSLYSEGSYKITHKKEESDDISRI